jgi:Galactosyltransferase
LGTEDQLPANVDSLLTSESAQYSDIVREDFLDSYENLTLKTLGGLKWAAIFCPQVRGNFIKLFRSTVFI